MTRSAWNFGRIAIALTALAFALAMSSTAWAQPGHGKKHGKKWGHKHGPEVVYVVHTGTLAVHNDSPVRWAIDLDGQRLGAVGPGETTLLAGVPVGNHRVVARTHAPGIPNQVVRARVGPGERVAIHLQVPYGALKVRNHQGVAVHLHVDGVEVATLPPGGQMTVPNLLPGRHDVAMVGPFGTITRDVVMVRAGGKAKWRPAPMVGTVRVTNGSAVGVQVRVGGVSMGKLAPGETMHVAGVPDGMTRIELRSPHGLTASHTLAVRPGGQASWAFVPAPGPQVRVVAQSGPPVKMKKGKKKGYSDYAHSGH